MKDDPELILDMIHALNQWMYETWQFNYEDRIFSTPVINLGIVDRALEELEWCLERGAKTVLYGLRRCPDSGHRSLGLPEFDPFWHACVKAGIPVSMHASDSGYAEYLNDWEPADEFLPVQADGVPDGRDGQAADRGHHGGDGLPRRIHPQPRSAHPVCRERRVMGAHLLHQFADVYSKMPQSSRKIRSRRSSAGCTSLRSGRTTSTRWPTCAASTGSSSARTGRTPEGLATPSTWSTTWKLRASIEDDTKGDGRQHGRPVQGRNVSCTSPTCPH